MSISTDFGNAQQWAQTHFGGVVLGDVRRARRVVRLVAGWAREPGASIPRLSQGQAYASKAAYQLLGHAQVTPEALQAPYRQVVSQQLQAPGTYLMVEDTTELSWPEAAEHRAGLGPVGPGKAHSQGVLLHSLVAAAWPATDPATRRPAGAEWWWPTAGPTSRNTCSSARPRGWASWCGPPKTGLWWPGRTKRPPAASSSRRVRCPAPARLPWPCAGGPASRHAR